ncbi:ATP-dependent DNA helicase PIF1-like protein [Tanacetum coccineum]
MESTKARTSIVSDLCLLYTELELSDTQRYNICLTNIEDALLSNSKSMKNIVNMPFPDARFTMENYNRLIYDELNYKIPDLINQHKALYGSLTLEQKVALRSKGEIVLNVASSGIAALLLDGGRIAHSRFAIPINIMEDSLCTITVDSDLADLIRTHNNSTDKVFGGKVIVFGGDFCQILPVIPNNTRQDVIHASLNKSYLWDHCIVLKLTENMRLRVGCNPGDADSIKEFVEWIMSIGDGKIGGKNDGYAEVKFPQDMLIPDSDDHLSIQPKMVGRERPKEDFLHHGAGNLLCKGHAIWLGLKNAGATYQRAMTAIFHEMIHVGLDLVEMGEPAKNVVRLPEVVEQKRPAYLELIGEELVVATLSSLKFSAAIGQWHFLIYL